jgi:methylisocitrate lyase
MRPERKKTLRELLAGEQVFAPCIWDGYSARVAELAGHRAIVLSGAALAGSLGLPNFGLMNVEELIGATARIADYSPLPLIVDADDGYGEIAMNAYRTCRRLAEAGAMAILLEDTTSFRGDWMSPSFRAGILDGSIKPPMQTREAWLSKIKAGLDAVAGTDCMLIARTGAKIFAADFDEAIERSLMARELGAEMTLVMGLSSLEECRALAARDPGPKMYPDVKSSGGVPDVRLEDVYPLGFSLVTLHYLEKASLFGMFDYARHVAADRTTVYADDHDMGGLSPDEQRRLRRGDRPWLEWQKEWERV